MSKLKIQGGKKLQGEVKVQGSKNEALQIISATLLTDQECVIHNVPDIVDVNNLLSILTLAGAKVNKIETNSLFITCKDIDSQFFLSEQWKEEAGKLRGSITLLGPALARFGAVAIPTFGGDKIGKRPIDTHINGFIELGYVLENNILKRENKNKEIEKEGYDGEEYISLKEKSKHMVLMEEASVTGTANLLMALAYTKNEIEIYNTACEPYIEQLCKMLNTMGMHIEGAGTNRLKINNKSTNLQMMAETDLNKSLVLTGITHTILSDFIEVASFIGLAAVTDSDIWIKNCGIEHLGMTLLPFEKLGVNFEIVGDNIHIFDNKEYIVSTYSNGEPLTIYSAIWPAVSPDILSILLVVAIQSHGTVLIHEKMYESRLFFTDKLIGMGAQIILCDPHRAIVVGLNRNKKLSARKMDSPDIRAGMALVIAALAAEGESTIDNAEQIDRGYEKLVERLALLGAQIERI